MTGTEHYREAEKLIRQANAIPDGFPGDQFAQTIAEAQVHATLAHAAATATARGNADPYDWLAWNKTLGGVS